jgi:hypothetical protein
MRDEFDALEANRLAPLAPLDHGEGGAGFPPRVETGTKERGCGLRRTQSSNQKYRVQKTFTRRCRTFLHEHPFGRKPTRACRRRRPSC